MRTVFGRRTASADAEPAAESSETNNGGTPQTSNTQSDEATPRTENGGHNAVDVVVEEKTSDKDVEDGNPESAETEKQAEEGTNDGTLSGSNENKAETTVVQEESNKITTTDNTNNDDDESKYPTGTKLALLTFGLAMATFVIALDNTIIATAIPRITTEFDSLNDVGWYGSSYLLTTTSLQPSFGKVYTYFDVKWVYLAALMIFELGSILCAAATGSKMLIVGRAVAGAGAAALFSGGMTIVGFSVPLRKRAMYIASLSSMFGIASVVGPILGGALTDDVSWRWCFWINLPFGAVALAAVFFFFSNPPRRYTNMTVREKFKQIDLIGALFLICAITCLLLALQWGGTVHPWSDSRVWGCLLGFGLLVFVFCAIQYFLGDRATMPPRIICGQRTVGACAMFSAFLAMALYTHIYYLPIYFQSVKGTTAEVSGIHCIPYLVSITISSIVVGAIITVLGFYNPPMWGGVVVFVVGCGMLHTLKVDSPLGIWFGYEILAGVGAGACVQIPFIAVQVVLDEKDMPVGNAVAIFFNTLGGAISISIAQNIFSNTLAKQLPLDAPTVDPRLVLNAGATHFRSVVPPSKLPGVLEAFNTAVTRSFILPIATSGLAALASLMMEWKSVKGKKLIPGGA